MASKKQASDTHSTPIPHPSDTIRCTAFSMAFVTDIIPGVFMAFLFGQMQLLALPLKAYMGVESYDEVRHELISILFRTSLFS